MRTIGAILLVATLAACQPASAPETPPPAEPVAPVAAEPDPSPLATMLIGGVDLYQPLRALGTEPFWGVEIRPDQLIFTGVDRVDVTATNPGPVMEGDAAVIAAKDATGRDLVVTLRDKDCSDGMSDWTYQLEAEVKLGDEILKGCADSQQTLDNRPAQ